MAHLRVGEWEVDPALNELRRGGEAIRLEPKAIEVLRYLAERPGEVVGREALLSAICSAMSAPSRPRNIGSTKTRC